LQSKIKTLTVVASPLSGALTTKTKKHGKIN